MPRQSRSFFSIQARPDSTGIRTQDFNGSPHLIIPMVILVEGVLHPSNSEQAELALASEFGKYPAGWDGRPVVYNHPKDSEGNPVSANVPGIVENGQLGQLFNTSLDGTKLKSEAWINLDRVSEIGGEVQTLINEIRDAKIVAEVSTGLFCTPEEQKGIYNNETFYDIWREVVPDHLAILEKGSIGACSVEDGCGTPRINVRREDVKFNEESNMPKANAQLKQNGTCTCGGSSSSSGQPVIELSEAESAEFQKSLFGTIYSKFKELIGFRDNREMNHNDITTALLSALSVENVNSYYYIIATYNDRFVYVEGWSNTFVQRSYMIGEDDIISLGADKVVVRPVTDFVPVSVKADEPKANSSTVESGSSTQLEDTLMKTREQRVAALIANQATKWEESDKEWLLTLDEAQLDKLEPEEKPDTSITDTDEADANPDADALPKENAAKPVTLQDYITGAPAEIQEVLKEGLRMQKAHRAKLVEGIIANSDFKKEELGAFDTPTLERLYKACVKANFAPLGAGAIESLRDNESNEDSPYADDPEPLVVRKSAA